MATGTLVQKDDKQYAPSAQQVEAWNFYGWAGPTPKVTASATANRPAVNVPSQAVGEVRYVVGWMADQMTRMAWQVVIDGNPDWTLELPDKTRVSTAPDPSLDEGDASDAQRAASAEVLDLIDWTQSAVRQITTNLFVAGEFDYIVSESESEDSPADTWQVVSVVNPARAELARNSVHRIRGLWPHPADPSEPDAPLFGVLSILQEMDWLSRLARSQSASRISTRGILGAADGLSVANGGDFWEEFNAAIAAKMADPTDVRPLMLRGAQELVEPAAGRVGGMKGLSWVIPTFPYDDRIDAQMDRLINRLAYGLPVPPEILLGMQAQSRATAFQVEENSYRAHIEPAAQHVAQVATDALQLLLPDVEVEVLPDPSELLARRHSIADTLTAWDKGLVSAPFVRDVLGIPESAAATEADLRLLLTVLSHGTAVSVPVDVGAQAAEETPVEAQGGQASPEAVAASVGGPKDDGLDTGELSDLSETLCQMDYALRLELAGATAQAVERAREAVGAQARSRSELRGAVPRSMPNSEVAASLGVVTLKDNGVPVEEIVATALTSLARWWGKRLDEAHESITTLLGKQADPGFTKEDRTLSVDLLTDLMIEHVLATLESPTLSALSPADTQRVLSVAGGTPVKEARDAGRAA